MILRRLRLQRFGRFTDCEFEFGPGLNVVRGPNEAGKSTIREAIVRLLFDQTQVTTNATTFLAMTTWQQDQNFVLGGEFEVNEARFEIEKDFSADNIVFANADGSEALHDSGTVNERLDELLGGNLREVYITTACLEQQDFAKLAAGRQVGELLQQTITGGTSETGIIEILDDLNKAITKMNTGVNRPVKHPGPIRAATDQIAELEREIGDLAPRVAAAEKARARLDDDAQRLADLREELSPAEDLLTAADKRVAIAKDFDELQKRCRTADEAERKARELSEKIETLQTELDTLPDLPDEEIESATGLARDRDTARNQAEDLARQAKELEGEADAAQALRQTAKGAPDLELLDTALGLGRELDQRETDHAKAREDTDGLETELANTQQSGRSAMALFVIGLGLLVAGITCGWSVASWCYGFAVVGLAALGAGLALRPSRPPFLIEPELDEARDATGQAAARANEVRSRLTKLLEKYGAPDVDALHKIVRDADKQRADETKEDTSLRAQSEQLKLQSQEQTARADEHNKQLTTLLTATGFADDPDGLAQACARLVELRDEREKLASELRGALGDRDLAQLTKDFSDLNIDRRALEEQLATAEMQSANLDGPAYQELKRRVKRLTDEVTTLEEEAAELQSAANDRAADPDRLRALEGSQRAVQERLALLVERRDALTLTSDLLTQANSETMSRAVEHLAPTMSKLLSPLTAGRYQTVTIDEINLAPTVHSEEKGGALDLDSEASCATKEQVFLAARLALTGLLWPDGPPPLLLDDPLVNFDKDRRAAALALLRDFAADAQVLVFTCHDWYDAAADHVVQL